MGTTYGDAGYDLRVTNTDDGEQLAIPFMNLTEPLPAPLAPLFPAMPTCIPKSLAQMADEVTAWCYRKGWEPNPDRTFGDEIALLHSELSEALEAFRDQEFADQTGPEPGAKPEGVGSELADVLIRLLHTTASRGFDLEAEYERKMAYNEGRLWRHGGKGL